MRAVTFPWDVGQVLYTTHYDVDHNRWRIREVVLHSYEVNEDGLEITVKTIDGHYDFFDIDWEFKEITAEQIIDACKRDGLHSTYEDAERWIDDGE